MSFVQVRFTTITFCIRTGLRRCIRKPDLEQCTMFLPKGGEGGRPTSGPRNSGDGPALSTRARSGSKNRDTTPFPSLGSSGSSSSVTSSTKSAVSGSSQQSLDGTPSGTNRDITVLYSQKQRQCSHTEPCDCAEVAENKFYFVTPDRRSEKVSTLMKLVFEACVDREISVVWITEREVVQLDFEKGVIFVFDHFTGPGFAHLEAKLLKHQNFMIIGPNVLRYMFERNVPEFFKCTGFPIYTLAMMNVVVTTTGMRENDRKKEMISMIYRMGGNYDASYTNAITHVVAASIDTAKVRAAGARKIPVMTPEWVFGVWQKSQREIVHSTDPVFASYTMKIFDGLSFTSSQITSREKQKLQQLIEQNGGTYSHDLIRKSTKVLIIPRGEGDKFRHAKGWKIPCIRPEWITDSCDAGYALEMTQYTVDSLGYPLSSTLIHGGTPTNVNDPPPMNVSCISAIPLNSTEMSHAVNSSCVSNDSVVVKAGAVPPELQQVAKDMQNFFEGVNSDSSTDLEENDNEEEKEEQVTRIPAKIPSTRPESSNSVLVLPHLEKDERKSGHEEAGRPNSGSADRSASASSGNQDRNVTSEGQCYQEDVQVEDDEDENETATTPEAPLSVFKDKRFFLALNDDPEAKKRTVESVLEVGGIVTYKWRQQLFDFIITTPIHSKEEFLKYQHYTEYWLEDCAYVNSTQCEPAFQHFPLLETVECKGLLTGCVIAVSSYTWAERSYLNALAAYMGAIPQEVFSKKQTCKRGETILAATHLVSKTMCSDKADAAVRWNLPVVTCDWILKCYSTKTRLDTAAFVPLDNPKNDEEKKENEEDVSVQHLPEPPALPSNTSSAQASIRIDAQLQKRPSNQHVRRASDGADAASDNINCNGGTVTAPQTPFCVHPRIAAIGGGVSAAIGGGASAKKLSFGLDSPTGTQERPVDSPVYEYIYPSMDQMLEDAVAARAMIPPPPMLDIPTPETPQLRRQWHEHMRNHWLNGRRTFDDSLSSANEEGEEPSPTETVDDAATAAKPKSRRLMLPKKNSSATVLPGIDSKRSKRTD